MNNKRSRRLSVERSTNEGPHPARTIRAKVSERDLTVIERLQNQAAKAFECVGRGQDGKAICFWLSDSQPVLRCDFVDCLLFLLKACPHQLCMAYLKKEGDES